MTDRTFHTGPPAFTSLLPEVPAEHDVSQDLSTRIAAYCGCHGSVRSLGTCGEMDEGRFVVRCDGRPPLFLKVFDARILELQLHSNRVAAHLAPHQVPVVLPLPGEPRPFGTGHYAALFPFVDARFSHCDEDELSEIGSVLARMHGALAGYEAGETRNAAAQMHARLVGAAEAVLAGWVPNAECAAALTEAARAYRSGSFAIHQSPQTIHGDCNYTNILFGPAGAIRVIDFEESRAAWLNPAFDVAKVIERFVLVPAKANARAVASAFIRAYRRVAGPLQAPLDLGQILVESNNRALMILADKQRDGLSLPAAEWRKFVQLRALAGQQLELLRELSLLASGAAS